MEKEPRRPSIDIDPNNACGVVRLYNPFRVKPLKPQIRKRFAGINELAASIKAVGQTTAIKVRLLEDDPEYDVELVDGERRLRACRLLEIPVRAHLDTDIVDTPTQFVHCVASNFGRQDHDCMEVAHAICQLQGYGKTQAEIADIFGRSLAWVSQHVSLLKLSPEVQKLLVPLAEEEKIADQAAERATIPFSIALLLAPLSAELQELAARKIQEDEMTLVAARRYVKNLLRDAAQHTEAGKTKQRPPKERWRTLQSLCCDTEDRVGIFLDMKGPEFDRIVSCTSRNNRLRLAEAFRRVAKDLVTLAEVIEKVE